MTTLLAVTALLLETPLAFAGDDDAARDRTRSPYFVVPVEGAQLPLERTHARVRVSGVIADVRVNQVYKNDGKRPLEAIYVFPASTRAAVYAMRMRIGRRTIEAEIRLREEAKKDYEAAKRQGKTASLLEQERPNVFQMSVANILPGERVEVELAYVELLSREDDVWELVIPAVVGPRYTRTSDQGKEDWVANPHLPEGTPAPYDFGLDVAINGASPITRVTSPSHSVQVDYPAADRARVKLPDDRHAGDRDFVLRYSTAKGEIDGGVLLLPKTNEQSDSYFLMMIEPPARERVGRDQIVPREYVFIVDVSGSMSGFPIETSKKLMRELFSSLRPIDRFNVLTFAGEARVLSPGGSLPANSENVGRALEVIDGHRGGGGTELLPALKVALDLPVHPSTDLSRVFVIATDGYVTVEKEAFDLVRNNLGRANLFAFGIGSSVNRHLIEGLARAGMGEPFVIMKPDDAERGASRFRQYIESPVLTGVEVAFQGFGAVDVEPAQVPDLFAQRPLMILGKYTGAPSGAAVLRGKTASGVFERRVLIPTPRPSDAEENAALRFLWARHRIDRLSDEETLFGAETVKKEITKLGLEHHLLTSHTSFVAIDKEVRADGTQTTTVRQPLPLPQGVSNRGAEGKMGSTSVFGLFGHGTGGGGVASHGFGGLGTRGAGSGALGAIGNASGDATGGAKSPVPQLRSAAPIVQGSIAKDVISRVILRNAARFRYCYQKALARRGPGFNGRVTIRFTIAPDGSVSAVAIRESTLNDPPLEQCVLDTAKKLRFPASQGDGEVIVTYPFTFKLSGD